MSTKKGYIVQNANGQWVIAQQAENFDDNNQFGYQGTFYKNPIPIHPDSLPTILSNGSLKPAYQVEVEYEVVEVPNGGRTVKNEYGIPTHYESWSIQYAIPKVSEDKGDVWEEADKDFEIIHMNNVDKIWESTHNGRIRTDDEKQRYYNATYNQEFINYLKQHYTLIRK